MEHLGPEQVSQGEHLSSLLEVEIPDGLSSSSGDLLQDFYIPCLDKSVMYQRAVGYFSSGLLALAPLSFANFAMRGGRMEIICSPHLRHEDLVTLQSDSIPEDLSRTQAHSDLLALRDSDDLANSLAIALSSLISAGVLDLRLLLPKYSNGLFHDKLGIFSDGIRDISFVGSANETAAAWLETGNHENLEVFKSWENEADSRRVRRHKNEFQELWQGPRGWTMIKQSEVKDLVFSVVQPLDVEVSLSRVRDVINSRTVNKQRSLGPKVEKNDARPLRPYQQEVLKNWKISGKKGIVSFATGGGKTLTAISAIKEWVEGGKPALVIVPSKLLHAQWIREILEEIPEAQIIPFGDGHQVSGRETLLRTATTNSGTIVVSTYATSGTQNFIDACSFDPNLLIIADEVHNAGQPEFRKFLNHEHAGPRLGLSATPDRYGDEEGTNALRDYFGNNLQPEFGIAEAIASGSLVPYEYDYEKVALTDEEFSEWEAISKQISRVSGRSKNDSSIDDYLKALLIKRARIAKSAAGKPNMALDTVRANYQSGDRWLIYCSDIVQLQIVRQTLSTLKIPLLEYHQQMLGDRAATLRYFSDQGGLMLAIKCLDEGVDIPEINKAVILASSTNPREYIQRRGRVLRRIEGKYSAQIWDTLVCDPEGRLLTIGEAIRAQAFAETSTSLSTQIKLGADMQRAGLEIDVDVTDFEEQEDAE